MFEVEDRKFKRTFHPKVPSKTRTDLPLQSGPDPRLPEAWTQPVPAALGLGRRNGVGSRRSARLPLGPTGWRADALRKGNRGIVLADSGDEPTVGREAQGLRHVQPLMR